MDTKTKKAVDLWLQKKHKESIAIFSKFRLNFSTEQKQTMQIAHDCLAGRKSFYQQIGYDTDSIIAETYSIINNFVSSYKH